MEQLLKLNSKIFTRLIVIVLVLICIACNSTKNNIAENNQNYHLLNLVDSLYYSGYILYDNKSQGAWFKKEKINKRVDSMSLVKTILNEFDFKLYLDRQLRDYPKAKRIGLGTCLSDEKFLVVRSHLLKSRYKLIYVEDFKFYLFEDEMNNKYYSFCRRQK